MTLPNLNFMRKATIILLLALIITTVSGCVKQEDVTFHGIEDVRISYKGNIKIELLAHIENESGANVILKEANAVITDRLGNTLSELVVPDKVIVKRHSDGIVSIPVYMKISNIFAALALVNEIGDNPDALFVGGRAVVKAGLMRKKIKFEKMPLRKFMDAAGIGDFDDYVDEFINIF